MATTREKMLGLRDELRTLSLDDTSPETRGLVELVQIGAGFGLDVFDFLVPGTDAEADVMIDQLLGLLHRVRGDDLPPFRLDQYGEAPAA
jgi:hypothetical protein